MSDSAQLVKIIGDILQPDNPALRKQSEDILTSLRNEKPSELITAYLDILKGTPPLIQATIPKTAGTSQLPNSDSVSPTSPPHPTPTSGTSCSLNSRSPSKLAYSKSSTTRKTSS